MIREICTLKVDRIPIQYYIRFEKDRRRFFFQASLKNKSAPSFTIIQREDEWFTEPAVDPSITKQAIQKVREIVEDRIFDRL